VKIGIDGIGRADIVGSCDDSITASYSEAELVAAHIFWQQTVGRLQQYLQAVSLGELLDEANNFSRFVINSGAASVLASRDNDGPLKVDSGHLRYLAEELRRQVLEAFARRNEVPAGITGALNAMRHSIDVLAGQVARISTPLPHAEDLPAGVIPLPVSPKGCGLGGESLDAACSVATVT
jgi:hypothetical protein